jgi:hypothetical protein
MPLPTWILLAPAGIALAIVILAACGLSDFRELDGRRKPY